MKKTITTLAFLLSSLSMAETITPPTDWKISGIMAPAKSVNQTGDSEMDIIPSKQINFTQHGYNQSIISNTPENTFAIIYTPYVHDQRLLAFGSGNNEKNALKNIQASTTTNRVDSPYEKWTSNYEFERHLSDTNKVTSKFNQDYQLSSITTELNDQSYTVEIVHLNSEDELKNITPKPETIYILTLEKDDKGSWIKQKHFFTHETDMNEETELTETIVTRTIEYIE